MKYPLSLPEFEFAYRTVGETRMIFDPIRRRYVKLTPEEWVRQHLVQFLVQDRGVPLGLVRIEVEFVYNQMKRRADVIVSARDGGHLLVAECKAPEMRISQRPFDQIARYNSVLHARFLLVTNGRDHFCCEVDHSAGSLVFLSSIPTYEELSTSI